MQSGKQKRKMNLDIYEKGIYQIRNILNNDIYIGSTTLSFKRRFIQHKSDLKNNTHRNIHLQRAYNKFSSDCFIFEILEIIKLESDIINKEQEYLDKLKPKYNIATIADNSAKGRKFPKSIYTKTPRFPKGHIPWNKGINMPEEACFKMSEMKKGKQSPHKGKIGISKKEVIRSDGKEYPNVHFAALELNVKPNTITKAICDKVLKRRVKGYYFKYKEKA